MVSSAIWINDDLNDDQNFEEPVHLCLLFSNYTIKINSM